MGLSAETNLILACCRPAQATGRVSAICDAAGRGFDPATLIAHARHHRVEGFVYEGLKAAAVALPPVQATLLDERVRRARLQMLRNTAEELRVTRALRDAGVDVLSFKGSTLSMLAHGTLTLKSAWDVDLLVRSDTRDRAHVVLMTLGYQPQVFDGRRSAREIERYVAAMKEIGWHHSDRGTTVEIHHALFDARARLFDTGMDTSRLIVNLPGVGALETLALSPLFAYLSVHGAQHGWIRLKWLTDIAGLIHNNQEMIETWYDDAVALGAGRTSAIALLLTHRLLGTELPGRLANIISHDAAADGIALLVERLIDRSRSDESTSLRPTFTQYLVLMTLPYRLRSGLGGGWRAMIEGLRRPRHPVHLKIPRALLPIAMLVWLPLQFASRPWRRFSAAPERWRAGRSDRRPRIPRPRPGQT